MVDGELDDDVAIVTGAGRNIGEAIARTFAREGAHVVVADIDEERATAVAEAIEADGGRAIPFVGDISDEADVTAMVETTEAELGPVDVLVNNATLNNRKGLFETTVEEFDAVMAVNVRGPFLCTREAARSMRESGGGRIVNVASATSGHRGSPTAVAYATAKSAIFNFTRSTAKALAPDGIRVNTLSPSRTGSPTSRGEVRTGEPPEEMLIGRFGEPQDQADAALFLVSDQSRFMTGAELVVDGGSLA